MWRKLLTRTGVYDGKYNSTDEDDDNDDDTPDDSPWRAATAIQHHRCHQYSNKQHDTCDDVSQGKKNQFWLPKWKKMLIITTVYAANNNM